MCIRDSSLSASIAMQRSITDSQPRHPRSSHWRAGCSESEHVRFGRGSSGRVQLRWHLARRPTSLIGNFTPAGRQWRPVGQPVETNTHDFPDEELGKAVPYGVYDVAGDTGWVSVGGSSDTAEFAVSTIRWSPPTREDRTVPEHGDTRTPSLSTDRPRRDDGSALSQSAQRRAPRRWKRYRSNSRKFDG